MRIRRSSHSHQPAPSGIRQIVDWILLLALLYGLVVLVFYVFPIAYRMASNADSLVMLDFARDVLMGQSLTHWNLPRAPYLFPDALIGLVVMLVGWSNVYTLKIIALINCTLFVWVSAVVLRQRSDLARLSYLQVGILLGLALLNIALIFPVSMLNVYWQLFASGAHFLMAIVVLSIFYWSARWRNEQQPPWMLVIIFLLCFAEALSDSLATLLLLIWMGSQFLWRLTSRSPSHLHPRSDVLCVFFGVLLGTLISFQIPRQSLLNSFFSFDKFINASIACWQWFISSPANYGFVLVLTGLVLAYPLLLAGAWPRTKAAWVAWIQSDALLPSLGVIAATPIFFQEVGSIRYLAFPALIALLSLALLYLRLWQRFTQRGWYWGALVSLCFALVIGQITVWQWERQQIGPAMQDQQGKDMIGLAVGAQTDLAIACLAQAQETLDLQDGVATYWNARPTRFASHFSHYLAQINPWRPRSGYMMWGNNGIDFIYRDSQKKVARQYNYLLATKSELANRLWGSLPSQANQVIECPMHTIYYFNEPAVLWSYLFPLELPFGFVQDQASTPANSPASSSASSLALRVFPADDFFTVVGSRQGSYLQANGQAGVLAYGPYIPLLPGRYRLIAKGHLSMPQGANALIDVSAQFGKQVLASTIIQLPGAANVSALSKTNIASGEIGRLDFVISKTTEDVEFRLQVPAQTRGMLLQFDLQKLPAQ